MKPIFHMHVRIKYENMANPKQSCSPEKPNGRLSRLLLFTGLPKVAGIVGMAFLMGCSSLTSRFDLGEPVEDEPVSESVSQDSEASVTPSFDSDTLYDLLVAEVAAYDKRYDLTLGNYLQQAHKTGDTGLAERAYQVASFLNARRAAGDAAALWLKVDPENPEALKASAIEQGWAGNLPKALAGLVEVKVKTGEAPFIFLAIQAGTQSDGVREELLAQYRKLVKEFPGDGGLRVGLAMLLHQLGDLEEALVQVDRAIKDHGEDQSSLLLKGRLLTDMERNQGALAMLEKAVARFPEAPRLRLLYGRLLVKEGDLTGAQKEFEELVRQQPGNPELLMSVALVAMENGMPGEAGMYLHRLSNIPGRADVANYYLGRLAEQMDDWREGRRHFLRVKPGKHYIQAYAALVRMLSDHEQWDTAKADLQEARKTHPDYAPQLYLMEGEVLLEQRGYDEAAVVYDQALDQFPDNIDLRYSRAMLAEKLDDLGRLEVELRRILNQEPDNAAALNALGYTLADRTDRYKEAYDLISRAYALRPDDPSIIDSMGWVEYRLGNYQTSLQYLKRAYELFNDAEVAAHYGEVAVGSRSKR